MKNLFKYPKEVYLFYIVSFFSGFNLIAAFFVPFIKDWGGLSQFQIQLLQSWFAIMIFFLEIPTGLIGDIKGRKYSVLVGFLFLTIAPLTYSSIPNFWVFMVAEFIFAVGLAFVSGAQEAFVYDVVKDNELERFYGKISVAIANFKLIGMIVSALFAGLLVDLFELNWLFRLDALFSFFVFLLIAVFIKDRKVYRKDKDLTPNYKKLFVEAMNAVKDNNILKRLIVFVAGVNMCAYFVIWFYPTLLINYKVARIELGLYRVILLISEIFFSILIMKALKKTKNQSRVLSLATLIIIVGFVFSFTLENRLGVLMFIILSGGIGLKYRTVFSQFLNSQISSEKRATMLSFISMINRFVIAIANLAFGYLADITMKGTLLVLTSILILTFLFFMPRGNDLIISSEE